MAAIVSEIGMKFNKDDIVIVAIAKIEKEIRKNIRESKARIKDIDEKINLLRSEFPKDGKSNIPKSLSKKKDLLEKSFKSSRMDKIMKIDIVHSVSMSENSLNSYSLVFVRMDDEGHRFGSIEAISESSKLTQRQKAILKEHESLTKSRQDEIDNGVLWKRKLQDIPAAERQMKAIVIENEMKKTSEGAAIVDLLTKNYMKTMQQIEM